MRMWASSWSELHPVLRRRWLPVRQYVEACFVQGMRLLLSNEADIRVEGANPAIFSGLGFYVPFLRILALNSSVALGAPGSPYPSDYRADLHELGHAVWSLLLNPVERWVSYDRLWRRSRAAGAFRSAYAASKIEEGWAEDFRQLASQGDEAELSELEAERLALAASLAFGAKQRARGLTAATSHLVG